MLCSFANFHPPFACVFRYICSVKCKIPQLRATSVTPPLTRRALQLCAVCQNLKATYLMAAGDWRPR